MCGVQDEKTWARDLQEPFCWCADKSIVWRTAQAFIQAKPQKIRAENWRGRQKENKQKQNKTKQNR